MNSTSGHNDPGRKITSSHLTDGPEFTKTSPIYHIQLIGLLDVP